jgi:hypothetical protein
MNIVADKAITYFDIGDHCIRVEASFFTGRETVFLNEQKVSEKRSWGLRSVHSFDVEGKATEVRFSVGSMLQGPIRIELWQNHQCLDADEWNMKRITSQRKIYRKQRSWKQTIADCFIFGMLGYGFGFLLAKMF